MFKVRKDQQDKNDRKTLMTDEIKRKQKRKKSQKGEENKMKGQEEGGIKQGKWERAEREKDAKAKERRDIGRKKDHKGDKSEIKWA